jgi:hypothetical protein
LEGAREAKVGELDLAAAVDEHVLWLEVAVQDLPRTRDVMVSMSMG